MFALTMALLAAIAPAAPASACAPDAGLNYVCGPAGSEDLALIPGTPFIVVSGLNVGAPAHLYLIDDRSKIATVLFPTATRMQVDPALRTGCPGPPDPAKLSTDGINIRAGQDGRHLLYAANHGGRDAIEIFSIDARPPLPRASWVGCVLLPAGTLANAVVPLADGGLLFSSFHDPRDKQAWERMSRGENTGSVWEWHAGTSPHRVATGGISGANGLELSADERTLYVSAWSSGKLLIIDRRSGVRKEMALGFLPDNIKRAPDGTLLVGGQRSSVAAIAACSGPRCPQDWIVARVDPASGSVTPLVARAGSEQIDYACGAMQVGDSLYITVRGDRRVAWLPLAALPSLR